MEDIILYFCLKYKSRWLRIYEALEKKESVDINTIDEIRGKIWCDFMSIVSSDYINNLKTIYKPPFTIFYHGERRMLNCKSMYVVGNIDENNKWVIEDLNKYHFNIVREVKSVNELVNHKFLELAKYHFILSNDLQFKNLELQIKEIVSKNPNCIVSGENFEAATTSTTQFEQIERMTIGITKNVLIISEIELSKFKTILKFCQEEKCNVYCLDNVMNKLHTKNIDGIKVIKSSIDMKNIFLIKS